jgi:hypothetical protein
VVIGDTALTQGNHRAINTWSRNGANVRSSAKGSGKRRSVERATTAPASRP